MAFSFGFTGGEVEDDESDGVVNVTSTKDVADGQSNIPLRPVMEHALRDLVGMRFPSVSLMSQLRMYGHEHINSGRKYGAHFFSDQERLSLAK